MTSSATSRNAAAANSVINHFRLLGQLNIFMEVFSVDLIYIFFMYGAEVLQQCLGAIGMASS